MAKLFADSGNPDQMPHSVASDLGLHCLPVAFLRVSRLQWVNVGDRRNSFPIWIESCSFSLSVQRKLQYSIYLQGDLIYYEV